MSSFPGHAFHFKATDDQYLLMAYMAGKPDDVVQITDCGHEVVEKPLDESRWGEFEELAKDANVDCATQGPDSSKWSCVRSLSQDEINNRNAEEYGFHADDVPSDRRVGQQIDWGYGTDTIHKIMNVSSYDKGYLKMQMTDKLKEILYPWYAERKKDSMFKHEPIAGGYTNNHKVGMSKINLDNFPEQHSGIVKEMQAVLQWWSKMKLKHTATFGARVYRRGSMLVNHVDRQDTHLASAVLQVSQDVDPNGGWPLEVVHPHFAGRKEVYLQPGEMVLYEGARLHHGRPMRLKGDEFGNIFSHFAPSVWSSPYSALPNPYYRKNIHHDGTEL